MTARHLSRATWLARAAVVSALFALNAWSSGCSLIVSFDGLTGSSPDGGGTGGAMPCAPSDCVDPAPTAWQGPVAMHVGAGAATPPACAGVALDLGAGSLDAPPASCTPCACDAPAGEACGTGVLTTHAGASCTGNTTDITETGGTGCQPLVSSTGNDWFTSAPVPTTGGACTASGGVATVAKATFAQSIRLCGASDAADGCANGKQCFAPASGYDPKPCIYRMGDVACDAPGFSVKHAGYTGVDDTRACAACSCSPPAGGTCSATTELYDLPSCVTLLATAHHDGSCTDAGGTESWLFTITGPPTGASCNAGATAPTGQASPSSAVTVCCAP